MHSHIPTSLNPFPPFPPFPLSRFPFPCTPPDPFSPPCPYPKTAWSYCEESRYSCRTPCKAALLFEIAGRTPSICCRFPFKLSIWLPICCDSDTSLSSFKSCWFTHVSRHAAYHYVFVLNAATDEGNSPGRSRLLPVLSSSQSECPPDCLRLDQSPEEQAPVHGPAFHVPAILLSRPVHWSQAS